MTPGKSPTLDKLLAFVEGDRWGGISSITITVNGSPWGAVVASAIMQFYPNVPKAAPIAELTTGAGTIIISSAAGWVLTVPSQNLVQTDGSPFPAGEYRWAFQTTDQGGGVQTYLEGFMSVLPKRIT